MAVSTITRAQQHEQGFATIPEVAKASGQNASTVWRQVRHYKVRTQVVDRVCFVHVAAYSDLFDHDPTRQRRIRSTIPQPASARTFDGEPR